MPFLIRVAFACLALGVIVSALMVGRRVALTARRVSLWLQLPPLVAYLAFWGYGAIVLGTTPVEPPFLISVWLSRLPFLMVVATFVMQQFIIMKAEQGAGDDGQRMGHSPVNTGRGRAGVGRVVGAVPGEPGEDPRRDRRPPGPHSTQVA